MIEQDYDGNEQAPDADQVQSPNDKQPKPGAVRKSTTHNILNALSNASGQQFDSVEAAIAYVARTAASQSNGGNVQPVEQPVKISNKVTTNDLHEQFSSLRQELAQKEQALREKELDSDIRSVMGDKFDSDLVDYAMNKVKSNIRWNDDGSYVIVNSKGQERYGQDGNPLTLAGLVNEVAKGNPKLLKQSGLNGGSGLRPGQNFAGAAEETMPDYSKDPAAFNAWAARNGLGKKIGLRGLSVSATVSGQSRKVL